MSREAQTRYRTNHPDRIRAYKATLRKGARPATYEHSEMYMAELARREALPTWVKSAIDSLAGFRKKIVDRKCTAAWAARNPETVAKHNFFHNSKRRGVEKSDSMLTWAQWRAVLEEFGGACAYCLRSDCPMTVDHMTALSKGGEHTRENVVPACKPCNSRKHARSIFVMLGSPVRA